MKINRPVLLSKYADANRYTKVTANIREDNVNQTCCLTLETELEEGEDTQIPLENILDEYSLNCTDIMHDWHENGKYMFMFELEGELKSLKLIEERIGGTIG